MVGHRLSYYIEKQGFKKKEFCEQYGFVYNNFVSVLSGRMPLGINVLNKVKEALPKRVELRNTLLFTWRDILLLLTS